ncbi:hypothetical protein MRQ47_004439 [Salmonella enterica]|nr:hypothetical protein [Salmonella enterica]
MNPHNVISALALSIGIYVFFRVRHYDKALRVMDEQDAEYRIEAQRSTGYTVRSHIQLTQVGGMLSRIRELATNGLNGIAPEDRAYLLALVSTAESCAHVPAPFV